jgi:hypothetical protein
MKNLPYFYQDYLPFSSLYPLTNLLITFFVYIGRNDAGSELSEQGPLEDVHVV